MDYARVHDTLTGMITGAPVQHVEDVEDWTKTNELLLESLPEVVEDIRARYGHVVSALRAHQSQAMRVRNLTDNVVRAEHVLGKARAERRAYLAEHPDHADAELAKGAPVTMAVVRATDAHEDAVANLETARATFAATGQGIVDNTQTLLATLRQLVPDPQPEPLTIYVFSRLDAGHGDIRAVIVTALTMDGARRLAEERTNESWDGMSANVTVWGTARADFDARVLDVVEVGE